MGLAQGEHGAGLCGGRKRGMLVLNVVAVYLRFFCAQIDVEESEKKDVYC